jgi:glucosamine-6-phosphate deaminase
MFSKVEDYFRQKDTDLSGKVSGLPLSPVIVDDYVVLGQLTALRFLEWVCDNPGGVVALPTGKTPEFFIKWTNFYLENWKRELNSGMLARIGFPEKALPDFKSLTFFQLDEFFPIHPDHERSFSHFVNKFYIDGFGFDRQKVNLLNTFDLNDQGRTNLCEMFSDGIIDLSLRHRPVNSENELNKKRAIQYIDQMCTAYEQKIMDAGGLGFFLGGIGPDGHIAFNIRGSAHDSVTRLDVINYETQAAAASDLGGIENVRRKAVVTMGLQTITRNPDCVAVIMAAGAGKANVVALSLIHISEPTRPY